MLPRKAAAAAQVVAPRAGAARTRLCPMALEAAAADVRAAAAQMAGDGVAVTAAGEGVVEKV